ncbi:MAG: hypothetical protein ACYCRE_05780, partial [Acidobacteriaceae bacterium]
MVNFIAFFAICWIIGYAVNLFVAWVDNLSAVRSYNWRQTPEFLRKREEWGRLPMTQSHIDELNTLL